MIDKHFLYEQCIHRWNKKENLSNYAISAICYRENPVTDVIIYGINHYDDRDVIAFKPFDYENRMISVNENEHIFKSLQKEYEILFMGIETHHKLWKEIEMSYPQDIHYKKGLKKYISYCKNNHITKKLIETFTFDKVADITKIVKIHDKSDKSYER